ncbi:MAG TPA: DNA polymerase Y family protein, partial [Chitinophagaceae bacterium]
MKKRFLSLWFPHLHTDWFTIRQPSLGQTPFVIAAPDHGRLLITAVNTLALREGISPGLALADARAIIPQVKYKDDQPGLATKLLSSIAKWCLRFTPVVAVDLPDGLMLDISGCSHLWNGEKNYLRVIIEKITSFGYKVRAAIADTAAAAWAAARFSNLDIIEEGNQSAFLAGLPAAALRINAEMVSLLEKLGLNTIGKFMNMPSTALRRRFGDSLLLRLQQAFGNIEETITPVIPACPYEERLISFEPVATTAGIEIGLKKLLEKICKRLQQEEKGCRQIRFTTFSIDRHTANVIIGTHRPSSDPAHLFKLFQEKITAIDPGLGVEVFVLSLLKVEDSRPKQEKIW